MGNLKIPRFVRCTFQFSYSLFPSPVTKQTGVVELSNIGGIHSFELSKNFFKMWTDMVHNNGILNLHSQLGSNILAHIFCSQINLGAERDKTNCWNLAKRWEPTFILIIFMRMKCWVNFCWLI